MKIGIFYSLMLCGLAFSSNAIAVDGYIGGVPVIDYYGRPVPDMFEISGKVFDDAMADMHNGVKDWSLDDFKVETDGKVPLPPGLPEKELKRLENFVGIWGKIIRVLLVMVGDQRKSDVELEFAKSQEVPIEVGNEEGNHGGLHIDPGDLTPGYTGDFGDGFGEGVAGQS